jgi:hypothetical protein
VIRQRGTSLEVQVYAGRDLLTGAQVLRRPPCLRHRPRRYEAGEAGNKANFFDPSGLRIGPIGR